MEESLFPRGKQKAFPSFVKRKRKGPVNASGNVGDDLFKADDDKPKRKYKRFKANERSGEVETVVEVNQMSMELLNNESIPEEILLLGIVQNIKKYRLVISLPNGMTGNVSVTDISSTYTEQLRNYTDNIGSSSASPQSLRELFRVGNYVVCKVKEVKLRAGKKPDIKLTLNPSELYADISSSCLQNSMVVMAAVKSIEDHGYIMDVGIPGLNAFLSNKMVPPIEKKLGGRLLIGQLVMCAVAIPSQSSTQDIRTLTLTAIPKQVAKALLEKDKMPVSLILPGSLLPFTVTKASRKGMLGQFHQRKIVANAKYFSSPFSFSENYQIEHKFRGRVLYTHPITNAIYVSLQTCHLHLNCEQPFGGLRFGDFVDDAKVEKSSISKVILSLNTSSKGILTQNAAACESMLEFNETYTVGSVHRCRISKLLLMDNIVMLSKKPAFIDKTIVHLEDVKPGDIVKCSVTKQQKNGLAVTVGENTRGFIPLLYTVDKPYDSIRTLFKPGKILSCRVLKSDFEKKLMILSSKKSMLTNTLPLITSYGDAYPGMVTQGCIVKVLPKGYLVAFYNDFVGYASKRVPGRDVFNRQLHFKQGELVTCKVQRCFPETNRIVFSIEDVESTEESIIEIPQEPFEIGKVVSCKVVDKSEEGLDVELLPSEIRAFIPVHHLSDHISNCSLLLKSYQIGDVIEECLCFSNTSVPTVIMRKSFIEWSKSHEMPSKRSDLKLGMVMPLFIKEFQKYGVYVQGIGSVFGLVHISQITGIYLNDIVDSKLSSFMTVFGKVLEISEGNRASFSMKLRDCRLPNDSLNLEFLRNFLNEREFIRQQLKQNGEDNLKRACSLNCGSVIDFIVGTKTEDDYTGTWSGYNIKGLVKDENTGHVALKEGESVSAVVLSVDLENCCLHLAVDKEIIQDLPKAVNRGCEDFKDKVVRFRCLLIDGNLFMGLVNYNGLKAVAYLPSVSHPNEVANIENLLNHKKEYFVKVESIHQHFVIATEVGATGHPSRPQLKNMTEGISSSTAVTVNKPVATVIEKNQKLKKSKNKKEGLSGDRKTEKQSISTAAFIVTSKLKKSSNLTDSLTKNIKTALFHRQKATILYAKEMFVFVKLQQGYHGRIHISDISDSVEEGSFPLAKFTPGQSVEVTPIGIKRMAVLPTNGGPTKTEIVKVKSQRIIECSMKESVLQGDNTANQKVDICAGNAVMGYVIKCGKQYVHFSLDVDTKGRACLLDLSQNPEVIREPSKYFKSGMAVKVKVISKGMKFVKLSLTDEEDIQIDSVVPGKILYSAEDSSIAIELPHGYKGKVLQTEIDDDKMATEYLEDLAKQEIIKCYITSVDSQTKEVVVSLRNAR